MRLDWQLASCGCLSQTKIVQQQCNLEGLDVRVKTENRRQAIIEVAAELFREVGFERATMAMISRRLGGSKGTLYGYFQSKEELFETAMRAAVEGPGDQIMDLLDPEANDLRMGLERFGKAYLTFVLGKEVLAITRTAVAEGVNSPLGAHLFAQGPGRAIAALNNFFALQMKRGRLRTASALMAALHFKSLLESGFLEEALYGAAFQIKRPEAVAGAVDSFLHAYGAAEVLTPRKGRVAKRAASNSGKPSPGLRQRIVA